MYGRQSGHHDFQFIILFIYFFISEDQWGNEWMLIENEECTDNVISYQFHVQNRLNRFEYNYHCESMFW